jgi:hypothetical protein
VRGEVMDEGGKNRRREKRGGGGEGKRGGVKM